MSVLSQTAMDALVEKIDKAILKHSVTNRDVAAALGYLNYILKTGESDKFLRKDIEDSAAGLIHFLAGIDVKEMIRTENLHVAGDSSFGGYLASEKFTSGFLSGTGWGLLIKEVLNAAGIKQEHAHLEVDDLTIRGRFRVYEMIISQLLGENGTRLTTDMMKVAGVIPAEKKILLDTEKGVLYNPFRPGDILMMKISTPGLDKEYELNVVDAGCGAVSEERQDWILYENFIGDESTIAAGDTLVRVDSLTDPDRKGIIKHTSVEPGSPYIDIISGMKTDPGNSVKSRFGRLEGLITKQFGQLKSVGLYCDNLYATGDFRLRNGDDVLTRFEILDGRISSEIQAVIDRFSKEDNFLRNAMFLNGMEYWEHPTDITTYRAGGDPLIVNRNFYSQKIKVAERVIFDKGLLLRILNSHIKQYNKDLIQPEAGRTLYITVRYKCIQAGTVTIGFEGQPLFCSEELTPTDKFVEKVIPGAWDGTGDFILGFTGDLYVSVLALAYNALQDFIIDTTTQFEQTAESIKLLAESYHTLHGGFEAHKASFHVTSEAIEAMVQRTNTLNDDITGISKTITSAGWITTADGNRLWATLEQVDNIGNLVETHSGQFDVMATQISGVVKSIGENADGIRELKEAGFITAADGNKWWASSELADGSKIISYINQTAEDVTINAARINLRGAVSFDDLDQTVITDGKIKTVLLDVDSIFAKQAKIGNFNIIEGSIFSDENAYGYNQSKFFMHANGDGFLGFSSKNAWVGIGLNTLPISGGWRSLGRFESLENDNWGVKLGLYINVGNSVWGRNFGIYSLQACISQEAFISMGVKKVYLTGNYYDMDLGRYSRFVFSSATRYNIILPTRARLQDMFNLTMFPENWGIRFSITLDKSCERLWFKPPEDGSIKMLNHNADEIGDIEMAAGDTLELMYFENYYRIVSRIN